MRAKLEAEERLVSLTSSYETQLATLQAEMAALRSQLSETARGRRPSAASKIISFLDHSSNTGAVGSSRPSPIPEDHHTFARSVSTQGSTVGPLLSLRANFSSTASGLGLRDRASTVAGMASRPATLQPVPSQQSIVAMVTDLSALDRAPRSVIASPSAASLVSDAWGPAAKATAAGESAMSPSVVSPREEPNPARRSRRSTIAPIHSFMSTTVSTPSACHHCHSLLHGVVRQAVLCANCQYLCHASCAIALTDGHQMCPSSAQMPSSSFDPVNVSCILALVCWLNSRQSGKFTHGRVSLGFCFFLSCFLFVSKSSHSSTSGCWHCDGGQRDSAQAGRRAQGLARCLYHHLQPCTLCLRDVRGQEEAEPDGDCCHRRHRSAVWTACQKVLSL
jgi:hypothetical protein